MKRHLVGPLALALALVSLPALASADKGRGSIVGTWKMVSLTIKGKTEKVPEGLSVILQFSRKGTYAITIQKDQRPPMKKQAGTYSLRGGTLTIVTSTKKKERAQVAFLKKGRQLRISKKDEIALLQRVGAKR